RLSSGGPPWNIDPRSTGPERPPPALPFTTTWSTPLRLAPRGVNGFIAGAALIALATGAARADQVTGLTAYHRSCQTFLTWTSPPGTGWIYRIYPPGVPNVNDTPLH